MSGALALLLVAAFLSGGCARREPPVSVLLVTIDTMRHDHLGCYGDAAVRTPTLDRLAAEGVLFETAITPQPRTAPAHASLLTGLAPFQHGLRRNGEQLVDGDATLAEIFRHHGYRTGAFVGGYPVQRRFGFGRGFDRFQDVMLHGTVGALPDARRENFAGEVADSAISWLIAADTPFFAWIHFFDPHAPYEPPPPFNRLYYTGDPRDPSRSDLEGIELPAYVRASLEGVTDLRYPIALYDGEIAYADACLDRVLAALEDRGLLGRTAIVLTSDHGESLSEHGYYFCHRDVVYEDNVRVPLVVRRPGGAGGGRIDPRAVSTLEVFSQCLALAGFPEANETPRGLARVVPSGTAFSEQHIYRPGPGGSEKYGSSCYAVREGSRKLIMTGGKEEFFDLESDPGEIGAAGEAAPDSARAADRARLRATLATWLRSGPSPGDAAPLDPEVVDALRSLGYVDD